jgi:hypothetical protein
LIVITRRSFFSQSAQDPVAFRHGLPTVTVVLAELANRQSIALLFQATGRSPGNGPMVVLTDAFIARISSKMPGQGMVIIILSTARNVKKGCPPFREHAQTDHSYIDLL